ncbi:hypothetical protein NEIELOOT_01018 [Neisseria elongata subsp. glycolytica ATCC 29315]|uniref:Uncharacterized protein n=1 Tax=Neisseria elongata subsp. glycolytica ATCC 29315 TaxID=546263 RepID=D4DPN1_NEIEG|nr:hypothetical protein NEIELOOT_01018 [Neisseria elongata subsp. glycolytica ATCC 29315]
MKVKTEKRIGAAYRARHVYRPADLSENQYSLEAGRAKIGFRQTLSMVPKPFQRPSENTLCRIFQTALIFPPPA